MRRYAKVFTVSTLLIVVGIYAFVFGIKQYQMRTSQDVPSPEALQTKTESEEEARGFGNETMYAGDTEKTSVPTSSTSSEETTIDTKTKMGSQDDLNSLPQGSTLPLSLEGYEELIPYYYYRKGGEYYVVVMRPPGVVEKIEKVSFDQNTLTFGTLDSCIVGHKVPFMRDSKTVVIANKVLDIKNPSSFECVGFIHYSGWNPAAWFKDSDDVYVVSFHWWMDDTYGLMFSSQSILKEADADSFTYVGPPKFTEIELNRLGMRGETDSYAVDKNYVYSGPDIIPDFDPLTFQVLPSGYIKDASRVSIFGFNNKPILDADAATFVVLGRGYAIDKTSVYYYGQILEGADVDTFSIDVPQTDEVDFAKDKFYLYGNGNIGRQE
jgi:hypothetical protein